MTLQVGNAILQKMTAVGDHAIRDSKFGKNKDGTAWEDGFGILANYYASNASGNWEVAADFFASAA